MQPKQEAAFTLPMAIVLSAAIIAGALLYVYRPATTAPAASNQIVAGAQPDTAQLPPVTANDHILGNPNAPIKIVEYSDPSCPYCKLFQSTMLEVMQDYGTSGQVAWVYRDFPLDQPDANGDVLHPLAGIQSNAFECAAALGGNAGFWAYEKDWFATFPQDGADEAASVNAQQMTAAAQAAGLDVDAFNQCVAAQKYDSIIKKNFTDGVTLGIQGTPTSYIVTANGSPIAIEGAQPYSTIKAGIDALLANSSASTTGQ